MNINKKFELSYTFDEVHGGTQRDLKPSIQYTIDNKQIGLTAPNRYAGPLARP